MSLPGKAHDGLYEKRKLILGAYVSLVLVYALIVVWFVAAPWASATRGDLKSTVFIGGVALIPLGAVARHQVRGFHPSTRTFILLGICVGLVVVAAAVAIPLMA